MGFKEKWQQCREAASLVAVVIKVFRIPLDSGNLKQWAKKG